MVEDLTKKQEELKAEAEDMLMPRFPETYAFYCRAVDKTDHTIATLQILRDAAVNGWASTPWQ